MGPGVFTCRWSGSIVAFAASITTTNFLREQITYLTIASVASTTSHKFNPTQSNNSANLTSEGRDTITCHKMKRPPSTSNQMLVKKIRSCKAQDMWVSGTIRFDTCLFEAMPVGRSTQPFKRTRSKYRVGSIVAFAASVTTTNPLSKHISYLDEC